MSEPHQVRIGDQQREDAITALNDHFASGRLEIGEYEQRVGYATAAQTGHELAALFQDLPQPHPTFLAPTATYPTGPPTGYVPPPAYQPPGHGHGYVGPTQAYGYPPGFHPHAPYGIDPMSGLPLSDKSRIVAGVLQLVLPLGIGRFYIGDHAIGVAQLLTCGGCGVWSLIDGIILLVNGGTDGEGRRLRD